MVVWRLEFENVYSRDGTEFREWRGGFYGSDHTFPADALYDEYGCTLVDAKYSDDYRFGCHNLEALQEYWGSDFAKLLGLGYRVSMYKVRKNYIQFSHVEGLELAFLAEKAELMTL